MFDTQSEIHITARIASGKTELAMRFPSDNEWSERARLRKIVIKRGGRGMSESRSEPNSDYDLKIYEAAKLNGAPALTPAEATRILDLLGTCEILGVELGSDDATVTLRVLGGEVHHTLNQPTAEQVLDFRKKAAKSREMPYNMAEVRILLEPGAKLWDACHGASEDYPNGVPALHKDAAARAVIDALDRELQSEVDETDSF